MLVLLLVRYFWLIMIGITLIYFHIAQVFKHDFIVIRMYMIIKFSVQ